MKINTLVNEANWATQAGNKLASFMPGEMGAKATGRLQAGRLVQHLKHEYLADVSASGEQPTMDTLLDFLRGKGLDVAGLDAGVTPAQTNPTAPGITSNQSTALSKPNSGVQADASPSDSRVEPTMGAETPANGPQVDVQKLAASQGGAANPAVQNTKPGGVQQQQNITGYKQQPTTVGKFNPDTMQNVPGKPVPTGIPSTTSPLNKLTSKTTESIDQRLARLSQMYEAEVAGADLKNVAAAIDVDGLITKAIQKNYRKIMGRQTSIAPAAPQGTEPEAPANAPGIGGTQPSRTATPSTTMNVQDVIAAISRFGDAEKTELKNYLDQSMTKPAAKPAAPAPEEPAAPSAMGNMASQLSGTKPVANTMANTPVSKKNFEPNSNIELGSNESKRSTKPAVVEFYSRFLGQKI
jgi:hypothetical protein